MFGSGGHFVLLIVCLFMWLCELCITDCDNVLVCDCGCETHCLTDIVLVCVILRVQVFVTECETHRDFDIEHSEMTLFHSTTRHAILTHSTDSVHLDMWNCVTWHSGFRHLEHCYNIVVWLSMCLLWCLGVVCETLILDCFVCVCTSIVKWPCFTVHMNLRFWPFLYIMCTFL